MHIAAISTVGYVGYTQIRNIVTCVSIILQVKYRSYFYNLYTKNEN